MKKIVPVVLTVLVLAGCQTKSDDSRSCEPGDRSVAGYPCWTKQHMSLDDGVIVNTPIPAIRYQGTDMLQKLAIAQIARKKYGVEVSENSLVVSTVRVDTKDDDEQVNRSSSVNSVAEIKSPDGVINVKTEILDEFTDNRSGKMYMWVREVE